MIQKQNDLSESVDAAFRETVAAVIERAKQTGTPIIVWEDGRIKELPSDQFDQPADQPSEEKSAS